MTKIQHTTHRARLFGYVAASAIALALSATGASAQEAARVFHIARQPLSAALLQFSKQADIDIVAPADLTRGKSAHAVDGALTPTTALNRLLEGTGLRAASGSNGGLILVRSDSGPFVQGAAEAPRATEIAELVVTVNKRVEPLSNIGAGVSAVTGEQLELMNANTVEDYLAFVPGVAFTSYGRPGQDQISIRGVASQALGAAIATYVDEVPVGSTSNEAQGATYTVDIDPADLDRVEVLKGPQGTLYGASSLGGVLKYVTKAPSLTDTQFETGADVNDIDHGGVGYKLRVAGTTPIVKDVLGLRLSGFYRDDAGFIDNVVTGDKNINGDRAWGFRGSLLFQPIEPLQIRLGAVVQRTNSDGLDAVSYNAVPNFPPPFQLPYGDLNAFLHLEQPSRVTDQIYTAEVHYDLGWASLISATGVSSEDIWRYTDVTATYTRPSYAALLHETPGSTVSDVNTYNINKTTEEVRLQSKSNDKFEWLAGFFYQDESSTTSSLVTLMDAAGAVPPQPYGTPAVGATSNDLKEYAGFANATWYILPNLDVSGGYRHSRIEQRNFTDQYGFIYEPATPTVHITRLDTPVNNVNTYSAGIRWRATSDVMLYARAASGFRPGGGRGEPPVDIPNFVFTYKPDSVWSYEAGIKAKALDGRVILDVDAFHIDWKNIQTLIDVGDGFLVQGNGGGAVSQGAEAQIQAAPFRGLSLNAAFAYTDAHYTDPNPGLDIAVGDQIQFVPKVTASLLADYGWNLSDSLRAFAGGDYRYRSSELDAIGFRMPGFSQWGLHAGVERGRTRINFYVINLTDERGLLGYTGGGNALGDAFRYAVNPPRTVGVSISQKW